MHKALSILALWSLANATQALQIDTLEVSRDEGVYHVVVEALIDAVPERVKAQLLDIAALPQLNPTLKSATSRPDGNGQRVESHIEECLFGICRQLLHVQRVSSSGNEITAETLPVAGSSFRSGVARWQVSAEHRATRLLFTADSEPELWLPPIIGPRLALQKLRDETLLSLQNLERLAHE